MWTKSGTIMMVGLAPLLASCAMPYYAAVPAPVYYPLNGAGMYYGGQRAGVEYPGPWAVPYTSREQSRSYDARRARPRPGEQGQAARPPDRDQSTTNDSGWIDPEP
jgi:hypothetical protein